MKFSVGLIATIALSVILALLAQAAPAGKPKPKPKPVIGNGRCRGKLYYTGNGMLASLQDVIAAVDANAGNCKAKQSSVGFTIRAHCDGKGKCLSYQGEYEQYLLADRGCKCDHGLQHQAINDGDLQLKFAH